ncbi:nodulin MtN21 /EamA-like transporter family protein [Striga asiatica]|uniref:WAT1-related protein n=1 Tax=Striga asiatica TaxID=4170 RepID=A0A5A7R3D3_STRAF|nr:nodulin MtN21 /EamA-like transporter family protein [Striga asiatica]
MEGKGFCSFFENAKPYIAMVCLQFGYAGMNIITKVSLNRGMSHYVLVVYRHAFATAVIAPFALVLERKVRPKITFKIFMQLFVLGLLGPVIDQNFYYAGLKFTSPTFSCAMSNMLPAMTFVMAVLCRKYTAQLSLTALVCFMGTLQSIAVTFVMEHKPHVWAIGFDMNLLAAAYAGIVSSGIAYYVQGLVMQKRGPVFVTAFSPLMMIIVAIMGSFILAEKIYVGGVLGAVLIVIGLYSVLWGKYKEYKEKEEEILEPIKGDNHNLGTIIEDIEANTFVQPNKMEEKENRLYVSPVTISAPMPQPPMLALEAPKNIN